MPSKTNTSGTFIDALTQVDLRFLDEMSPEELADF